MKDSTELAGTLKDAEEALKQFCSLTGSRPSNPERLWFVEGWLMRNDYRGGRP